MTYIEFFARDATDNVSACLMCVPDRVIYIGHNGKRMQKHISNYREVFLNRGQEIEFSYKVFVGGNLENAINLLSEIVHTYEDCVFDLTGGDEILLLALGVVYAKFPEKNIQLQKLNLRSNTICDCDKDGVTVCGNEPALSVEENVRIYGGAVTYGDVFEEKTYLWDLNPEFVRDLDLIWSVCKGNVRYWNTVIGVFEAVNAVAATAEDELTTVADKHTVEGYLVRHGGKYMLSKGIIRYLLKNGLLVGFEETDETIKFVYKNKQVKKCLTKAGQALEMRVYLAAKSLRDAEGDLVYNDVLNGVLIDWDGELHDEETQDEYDTENEIDVLMMHNIFPIFVSCKNGAVNANELYKLSTVAHRFGGSYAKTVLVTTALTDYKEADLYLRQRAKDMGIYILDDISNLDDAGLAKKLRNLWR